jgi:hypothetical protein
VENGNVAVGWDGKRSEAILGAPNTKSHAPGRAIRAKVATCQESVEPPRNHCGAVNQAIIRIFAD